VTSLKGTGQDITENKKIELEIIQSHQKIDTLINTIDGIVWEADAVSFEFTFISKKAEDILGYPAEQWINEPSFWANHIHPEDRNRAIEYCMERAKEKKQYDFEYRMVAKDGSTVWFRDIVTVIVENGATVQLRGILIDITENKKIENALNERTEQLTELSTYLQEVREEERANIAREIHDELGQQLTGLKMDITWLMKKVLPDDPVIKNKFEDSIKLIDASVKTIRRITTELRPSIIDDLGLNAAFEWLVADFSKRMGIEMQYQNNFDDADIDSNVSIGLFRILQESLTNIARHAGAKKVVISIENVKGEIRLSIQDDGKGFEPSAKQAGPTFGLLGIKERTYMMKGDCEIYSKPGEGTRISIHIPVA
jgi:PAS domain S-box-containing protein